MKKPDQLEIFIETNREAFDSERPSLKVWSQIAKGLDQNRNRTRFQILWLSAAAIGLLLIGAAAGALIYPKIQQNQALQALNESLNLDEIETFYRMEVSHKLAALNPSTSNEISQSLQEIDAEINRLKLELIYAPKSSREELLQAIIASYESKIHILQSALEIVNPDNMQNDESKIL